VIWIPEKFAKIGKYIKIKENDIWDNGWEVIEVWAKKELDSIEDKERDFLKQRKASDV
jgi:hypothetical protein